MAAKGDSSVEVQRNLEGFIAILTSAACEWFLIFLLLVDALLSYLLTKFADYCNLQKPCILCSRFEHIIGNEKPQLYQDLLCSNHISELSSFIACQIYGKHDGNGMCEDCLLSFTRKDKSKPEMHMFLAGKSGLDLGGCSFQMSMQNGNFVHSSVGVRPCSCCGRSWRPRENVQGLELKSSGIDFVKPNIPLPRVPHRSRANRRDGSKKTRDRSSSSVTNRRSGKFGFDPLSHVGYTELNISSDTDSEFLFSDYDNGSSGIGVNHGSKKEGLVTHCASKNPLKAPPNGLNPAKQSNRSYKPKPSPSDPCVQPDGSKASDVKFLGSDIAFENGLDEPNWQQANRKSNPSALPELISLDDIPPSSNAVENNVTGTSNSGHGSINKKDELLKSISATNGASVKTDMVVNDPALIEPNHISANAVSESVGSSKERDPSGLITEQPTVKESDRVDEESNLLASQNSSAQEINLSSKNISSRVHGSDDEKQITDASSSSAMLRTSVSVESGLESLDEGYVSEIEGESIVDRLKRQVEYDRKCIKELYKELEEERNASAVAANQAMAMITKLQEEKAAFHMEALHYLRMMEEQAEFDVEALEKANDLLAEKEKEIQDLEAELEYSRVDFPEELAVQNMNDNCCELKGEIDTVESTVVPSVNNDLNVTCDSMVTEISKCSNEPLFSETTLLEFEDEKLYISNCLKSLERKLSELSCNSSNMPNGGHSKKHSDFGRNQEETPRKERILLNGQNEENVQHGQKDLHITSNGSSAAQAEQIDSDGSDDLDSEEINDLHILENEISDLNDRLESLETDHDFLEHMVYSLQNGEEGLRFVKEIAYQLGELRKIGTGFRCQSVS